MASINVETIYNRFRAKCEDPIYSHQWLEVYEYLEDYLRTAISNYRVIDLFDNLELIDLDVESDTFSYVQILDDENNPVIEQGNETYKCTTLLNYTFKKDINELVDREFLIDILSRLMLVAWYEPRINSVKIVNQMFGGKEENFYSQSNHLTAVETRKSNEEKIINKKIRDRSRRHNSYLDGGE